MLILNCNTFLLLILLAHDVFAQRVDIGFFQGQYDTLGTVMEFRGIPYAEAPVGPNRFRPPLPATPPNITTSYIRFGASCMQNEEALSRSWAVASNSADSTTDDDFLTLYTTISEDCLFLNIFAPDNQKADNNETLRPVMMFIHGGDFVSGASSIYKGTKMAAEDDVIVVTINYRLGAFGFLTDGGENSAGNFGLLDQRMALDWIKDNIEPFGGDPERITLFGEGAGASSVHLHVMSAESNPLFSNAIVQSATYNDAVWTEARAVNQSEEFRAHLNLTSEELWFDVAFNKGADELLEASHLTGQWRPHIDSQIISGVPSDEISRDNFTTHLNLLSGSNADAGAGYSATGNPEWLETATALALTSAFPELYENLNESMIEMMSQVYLKFYGGFSADEEIMVAANAFVTSLFTDQLFGTWSQEISNMNCEMCSAFQYKFGGDIAGLGQELPYVFGYVADPQRLLFSVEVRKYWTNFAKSGNPNHPENVTMEWSAYDVTSKNADECRLKVNLDLDGTVASVSNDADDVTSRSLDFWMTYYKALGFSCDNETVVHDETTEVPVEEECEENVGEIWGVDMSNELASTLLIVFIALTGAFLIAFIVAITCYCKTKKKLEKEKKKNKRGHDNPITHEYKL